MRSLCFDRIRSARLHLCMDLTLQQRGAIPVELDRPWILFFDMAATGLLLERYGRTFLSKLYSTSGQVKDGSLNLELLSVEVLSYFLYAGLQADARQHGETLTLDQAAGFIHPWTLNDIFLAVVYAAVGTHATPAMVEKAKGKAQADGAAAKPPAAKKAASVKGPGPTKASTSMKRSASRSRASAGRRRGSGR